MFVVTNVYSRIIYFKKKPVGKGSLKISQKKNGSKLSAASRTGGNGD